MEGITVMNAREMEIMVRDALSFLISIFTGMSKDGVNLSEISPRTHECLEEAERRADSLYNEKSFHKKSELFRSTTTLIKRTGDSLLEEITAVKRKKAEAAVRVIATLAPRPVRTNVSESRDESNRRARQLSRAAQHKKGPHVEIPAKGGTSRKSLQKQRKRAMNGGGKQKQMSA